MRIVITLPIIVIKCWPTVGPEIESGVPPVAFLAFLAAHCDSRQALRDDVIYQLADVWQPEKT